MARSIDSRLDFLSPVSLVPGLGEKRVLALNESGIFTLGDLLHHFPRRYIDRSVVTPIAECGGRIGATVNVLATITRARVERGRRPRLRIQLSDSSGTMEALWFAGVAFFRKTLSTGLRVLCTGTVSYHTGVQMVHPAVERLAEGATAPDIFFLPVYPLTLGMKEAGVLQKVLRKTIIWALDNIQHYPQLLPRSIEEKCGFSPLDKCIREMHLPSHPDGLGAYRARLVYEELYRLAVTLRWSKRKFALPGRSMTPGTLLEKARALLPFTLTAEQEKAVAVLHADAKSPCRMHRLLQGDVGAGKSVVAFLACLPALNQGMQAAWLVPTEILARQAHDTLSAWLSKLDIQNDLVLGQSLPADRRRIAGGLADGSLKFLVGTHSLLSPWVKFQKLGMIVIDEQHKFGAEQRLRLAEKDPAADLLVMSATPIPQTLAKTLYGDLDIVSIQSTLAGRLPVSTHLVPETKRAGMEQFILGEIRENNGQVFYVAPRIERDDDSDDGLELKDVQSVFDSLRSGPFASVEMALVHGDSDPIEREKIMKKFAAGHIKVLVSTTIVEVGIDVPGATVLVVENADRFGLSQLHQIRGRVGRSSKKSYCFLLANALPDSPADKRLAYFCSHHNGFDIAEQDLLMRGPGEVGGFRQTGWEDLRLADMVRDAKLFCEIQNDIEKLFSQSCRPAPL
jgi:ATP-dependent DNA helicase RecG